MILGSDYFKISLPYKEVKIKGKLSFIVESLMFNSLSIQLTISEKVIKGFKMARTFQLHKWNEFESFKGLQSIFW